MSTLGRSAHPIACPVFPPSQQSLPVSVCLAVGQSIPAALDASCIQRAAGLLEAYMYIGVHGRRLIISRSGLSLSWAS